MSSSILATASRTVASAASASPTGNRAVPQGGVIEGLNPTTYDAKNPIVLFIIQAGIIIIFCRILHFPLAKLRQPRVIAEVIGGVILGPSVMMRIPGFKDAIFPQASMAGLNLVANLGLILFLFLVGLEVNMRMFITNWRVALSVGLAGMALPFGLGCGIAYGLYHQFRTDEGIVEISFGVYMLFIGTALSITAFPVLCRILTELKLLSTAVGVTVLAAGVGNDVVGWILLALCVALVNNGSGIAALYVLLAAVGWILFLVYAIRPVFMYFLRRSGSIQNGPTQGMMAVTILLVLTSSWFTQIIGVHAIFGAFLVGLICPHDGGFAIKLTEKVEDLVSVLFLPLYFALSGLGTNLGLLNDGITWGYVIGVIAIAFAGKIIGGTLAARANKLVWRESLTIGCLMSCKGLVELIVLNIGLQAKILSTRTFTMFVVMALVTTVATTPLVLALYPPWYQKKLEAWKRGEIDWDGNRLTPDNDTPKESVEKLRNNQVRKLLVYLRLDSLPSLFTFIALLGGDRATVSTKIHKAKTELATVPEGESSDSTSVVISKRPLEVHGVRILELTERTSSVMQSSELDDYGRRDPVVNAFRTFAQLNNVAVSGDVSIVPEDSYAETLIGQASDHSSDLVLIPWNNSDSSTEFGTVNDSLSASVQDAFIQKTLETATCNTAVFYNRGFGGPSTAPEPRLARTLSGLSLRSHRESTTSPIADRSHHVYFPFFGGADDRVALRFVLQLAQNSNVTVTVVHFNTPIQSGNEKTPEVTYQTAQASGPSNSSKLTIAERVDTETMYATAAQDVALLHTLRDSLSASLTSRVVFVDIATTTPITDCLNHARQEIGQSPKNAGDLIVVGRGKHSRVIENFHVNNYEMRRTLGHIAEAIISGGVRGSVLVIKAGASAQDS
ncbi:K(+)/H(+) antiporter [Cadophora gregata]|uniref:K(+)/H(+) antiporter n=1 Tax=Cadophora gregata TaxID=51156 RepID=UPI0026DAE6D0|nr:K(+)/H(+) antiporter [Cadophora gregata]KAK0121419.1 K(+)/H(+) antiporter [Cadophora gregata]